MISAPGPSRQLAFHQQLVFARKAWLHDALREASGKCVPEIYSSETLAFVPPAAQQLLAASGIRVEDVFPIPCMLELKPSLVGYYRLLLGIPQKSFYTPATGMTLFKSMESKESMSARQ